MTTIVEIDYVGDSATLAVRAHKVAHKRLLTPALADNEFFSSLMLAWDVVEHNFVTEPRRELGRMRSLYRRDIGDYFIINGEQLSNVRAALSYVFLTDRELPPLLTAAGLANISDDPREIPEDQIEIYWDRITGENTRERTFATITDRVRIGRQFLVKNANMLGFEFLSDELSTEGYWRLAQYTSMYWEESSTYGGLNFLGWILNAKLAVEPLWSNDGENFIRYSLVSRNRLLTVFSGVRAAEVSTPLYFPTSRVLLLYNVEENPDIDLEKLREFFLTQAPINVVLHGISSLPVEFPHDAPSLAGTITVARYTARAE